jgi:hypothetical protein
MQWPACASVPQDSRFPLIGDPDRSDLFRRSDGFRENLASYRQLRFPNLRGIMLDPASLGVMLCELALCDSQYVSLTIEQDGSRTGRSLVERENQRSSHKERISVRIAVFVTGFPL